MKYTSASFDMQSIVTFPHFLCNFLNAYTYYNTYALFFIENQKSYKAKNLSKGKAMEAVLKHWWKYQYYLLLAE